MYLDNTTYLIDCVVSAADNYRCCIRGTGLAWRLLVLALGSMNVSTVTDGDILIHFL